jgi:hypothetical protein
MKLNNVGSKFFMKSLWLSLINIKLSSLRLASTLLETTVLGQRYHFYCALKVSFFLNINKEVDILPEVVYCIT